ncbi:lysylphosphatidylglycerol synthase transmembrane domain-containing protein [Olivibacter sp. CPCC 100613]|uniref:lysylphosphatidylglycerol synthase transmembrane domain-containing protein n=1 Tax=Olivibacter sp. CPCC 100613 TaxID=3079931 RepID=UPI002FFA4BA4
MSIQIIRFLKLTLKILLTGIALYWVQSKVDLGELKKTLLKSDFFLLAGAFLFFLVSQIFASLRVRSFFSSAGLTLSEWSNYKLYLLGMFYNMFFPGGVGGDGYKVFLLRKKFMVDTRKLIGSIFFDKLSGLWALGVLTLLLTASIQVLSFSPHFFLLIITSGTLIYFTIQHVFFKNYNQSLPLTHVMALGVQIFQLLCVFCIIQAVHAEPPFVPYLLMFMTSSLLAIVPFTIGGLGARELVFLYGAEFFSLDTQLAVTISLLFYIISALSSLPGVYFVFNSRKLGL